MGTIEGDTSRAMSLARRTQNTEPDRVKMSDDVIVLSAPDAICSPVLWDAKTQSTVGRTQKRCSEVGRKVASIKRMLKEQGVDLPLKHLKGTTYLLGQRKL